jgi:hypothetical protein
MKEKSCECSISYFTKMLKVITSKVTTSKDKGRNWKFNHNRIIFEVIDAF